MFANIKCTGLRAHVSTGNSFFTLLSNFTLNSTLKNYFFLRVLVQTQINWAMIVLK